MRFSAIQHAGAVHVPRYRLVTGVSLGHVRSRRLRSRAPTARRCSTSLSPTRSNRRSINSGKTAHRSPTVSRRTARSSVEAPPPRSASTTPRHCRCACRISTATRASTSSTILTLSRPSPRRTHAPISTATTPSISLTISTSSPPSPPGAREGVVGYSGTSAEMAPRHRHRHRVTQIKSEHHRPLRAGQPPRPQHAIEISLKSPQKHSISPSRPLSGAQS
jgi:hypothetical protein